jgi:hypothetical protein
MQKAAQKGRSWRLCRVAFFSRIASDDLGHFYVAQLFGLPLGKPRSPILIHFPKFIFSQKNPA